MKPDEMFKLRQDAAPSKPDAASDPAPLDDPRLDSLRHDTVPAEPAEAVQLEILPADAQKLELAVKESGLEGESATELVLKFQPLMAEAKKYADMVKGVTVTDISQTVEMKLARTARLALRDVRVRADKLKVKLKADSLRRGKAIDGVFHVIEYLIEPMEAKLLEMEQFEDRAKAATAQKLKTDREELLRPYSIDTSFYSLDVMPEESFARLLEDSRRAHQSKVDERIRMDNERRESERLENLKIVRAGRLHAFAKVNCNPDNLWVPIRPVESLSNEEFESALAFAQKGFEEKKEKERKRQAEKDREAQAIRDRLQSEKDEADKKAAGLQKQIDDRKKADEAADKKKKADAARTARAPDAAKLRAWANAIRDIPTPAMKTDEGASLALQTRSSVNALCKLIESEAAKL